MRALLKGARWILSPKPLGLKRSDSRWKAWDVRKMLGPAETERGSDRDGWSGREGCAFLSVFTLYVHLYLYHFVYLYLDSHTAPDFFGAHSHWWSLRKRKRERREGKKKKRTRRSGALLPWPPSLSAMFTVSIAYRSTPPRDHPHRHTHTTQRYLRVRHMHTWTRARRCLRFFSKGGMR